MNTGSRYSLIRNIYEPIDEAVLKQAVSEVGSLTYLDAKRQMRNQNYGYVLSHVGRRQAKQLHEILKECGIETVVVPDVELYVPPLMGGQTFEIKKDGMIVTTQMNQQLSFSWQQVAVVAIGYTPEDRGISRSILVDNTDTEYPLAMSSQQRYRSQDTNLLARMEIVLNEDETKQDIGRIYFIAERMRFPTNFRDNTFQGSMDPTVEMLCRLQRKLKQLAPQASLNRDRDHQDTSSKPGPRTYPSLDHFHEEIAWLYWFNRQSEISHESLNTLKTQDTDTPAQNNSIHSQQAEPIEHEFNVPDLLAFVD